MVAGLETAAWLRTARIIVTSRVVRALLALWRRVLGRREIAAALRRASTSAASPAPAKASSTAVAAAVASKVLSAAAIIAAVGAGILLRRVKLSKILRSGCVRFRLALFGLRLWHAIGVRLTVAVCFLRVGLVVFVLAREIGMHRLFPRNGLLRGVIRVERGWLIGAVRVGQRFAGQSFHQGGSGRNRRRCVRPLAMAVVMIVVFEIFEDVADVQERVAVQSDIDERRLHTGEHAGDPALIDAADQRELFFALDVNFD